MITEWVTIISVACNGSIVHVFITWCSKRSILPAEFFEVIICRVKTSGPVDGTNFAVQHGFYSGHRSIVKIRSSDPHSVQWRSNLSIERRKLCRMIAFPEPTFILPLYEIRILIVGFIQKRIGPDERFRNE